jgi:DNA-binding response OmpR family regulator
VISETQAEQLTACIREINQSIAQAEVKLLLAKKRLLELGAVLADLQQLQERPVQQARIAVLERIENAPVLLQSGAQLDLRRKMIRRGDRTVALPRKSWELLRALLQGPKTNAELLLELWGGAGGENNTRKRVCDVRKKMALVNADSDLALVGTGCYELLVAS